MTDRTASRADTRKRNRDMADAHATARARDAYRTRTHAIDPETGTFTPLTQESDMPTDEELDLQIIRTALVTAADTLEELLGVAHAIRDRLPEREVLECGDTYAPLGESCTLPSGHGGRHDSGSGSRWWYDSADAPSDPLVDPDPADDLPGEPVEPGDLRAGDRVAFTWEGERITCTLLSSPGGMALFSDVRGSDGYAPNVTYRDREWADGISDVRLIERAPREDEHHEYDLLMRDRNAQAARAEKAEAERDALREQLDALRAGIARLHSNVEKWHTRLERDNADGLIREALRDLVDLARDDERGAR